MGSGRNPNNDLDHHLNIPNNRTSGTPNTQNNCSSTSSSSSSSSSNNSSTCSTPNIHNINNNNPSINNNNTTSLCRIAANQGQYHEHFHVPKIEPPGTPPPTTTPSTGPPGGGLLQGGGGLSYCGQMCGTPADCSDNKSSVQFLCAGCGQRISDRFYLEAVDRIWHAACLQCCQCRNTLDEEGTCFSRDGNIYCKKDYYR